tara:strand:- start:25533 stop:27341 length:1809 start_codon:yes stop_codon:yes gene_type:complete
MSKNKRYTRRINYTSRDFTTIKEDLVEQAKVYYPDTYKDFNDSSFGSMLLDTVAYVGDQLSFYLDYQANESFLDTAIEYQNVVRHAKSLGYRWKGVPSSTGAVAIYIVVPASATGMGVDMNYVPVLKAGAQLRSSQTKASFILVEDIDFSEPFNEIVAARRSQSTGQPTHYAIKAHGKVISGELVRRTETVGTFEKFLKLPVGPLSIVSEVLSVRDDEGHEYYQVEYLSQDVIYKDVVNKEARASGVPSVLRPFSVPRRYILESDVDTLYVQFGHGSDSEASAPSVVEPLNTALDRFGKTYNSEVSFDPSNLLSTDKLGISPANTSVHITYRINTADTANAGVGMVDKVTFSNFVFKDERILTQQKIKDVQNSIECFNEEPIVGDITLPTSDDIKRHVYDNYATQNRAVTQNDYMSLVYSMDPKYGKIKRCNIMRDPDSLKRNLNLYVLAEDENGKLSYCNDALKSNLKMWLNQYRMINDTIDILSGKIVNFKVDFSVVSHRDHDKHAVLNQCIVAVSDMFNQPLAMGEPIYISDIQKRLNDLDGVVDVKSVKVQIARGGAYSDTFLDLNEHKSADGRYIKIPLNCSAELKYAQNDIKGTVA